MCDTPIARITGWVSSLRIYAGDSSCNYNSVAIRVNRVMLGSLCAETMKPIYIYYMLGHVFMNTTNKSTRHGRDIYRTTTSSTTVGRKQDVYVYTIYSL